MLVNGPQYYELPPPQSTATPGGLKAFNACAGTFTAFNPELIVACGVTLGACASGAGALLCGSAGATCGVYTSALLLCYRAAHGMGVPGPSQEYNVPAP